MKKVLFIAVLALEAACGKETPEVDHLTSIESVQKNILGTWHRKDNDSIFTLYFYDGKTIYNTSYIMCEYRHGLREDWYPDPYFRWVKIFNHEIDFKDNVFYVYEIYEHNYIFNDTIIYSISTLTNKRLEYNNLLWHR